MLKIVDTLDYALWTGSGAYTLVCSSVSCNPNEVDEGRVLHVQGDAALRFERDWIAFEKAFPDRTTNQIMAKLWETWHDA